MGSPYVPLPDIQQPSYLQTLGQVWGIRERRALANEHAIDTAKKQHDLQITQRIDSALQQQPTLINRSTGQPVQQQDPAQQIASAAQRLRAIPSPEAWAKADDLEKAFTAHQTALAALQKQQQEVQDYHIGQAATKFQAVLSAPDGMKQNAWTDAVKYSTDHGLDPEGHLSQIYDPGQAQYFSNLGQTAVQQIQQKREAQQLALQQQIADETADWHLKEAQFRANEPGAQQARATALYAKMNAGQTLTPEEGNFLHGWERMIKTTRTDPGLARAYVFANSVPVQVVDPNNPGKVVYTNRPGAMGMEAPGSGNASAFRKMLDYMGAGKGGQMVTAFNTAQSHMQLLGQAAAALNNGNITALNSIGNSYAKATGSAAPTNFAAVKNALKGEVAKALAGNVTVSEQAELDKDFNDASSPAQIAGIIDKYTQLMQGKKDALYEQAQRVANGEQLFEDSQPQSWQNQKPGALNQIKPPAGARVRDYTQLGKK